MLFVVLQVGVESNATSPNACLLQGLLRAAVISSSVVSPGADEGFARVASPPPPLQQRKGATAKAGAAGSASSGSTSDANAVGLDHYARLNIVVALSLSALAWGAVQRRWRHISNGGRVRLRGST